MLGIYNKEGFVPKNFSSCLSLDDADIILTGLNPNGNLVNISLLRDVQYVGININEATLDGEPIVGYEILKKR